MSGVRKKAGYFTGKGGIELYCHSHAPKKMKGALAVVHGLGEHSHRYSFLLDYFLPLGWGLYFYDQRGHGRSPGKRAHASRFSDLVGDLSLFLKKVHRQTEGLPLFLVGHSFGAEVAVNYLAEPTVPLQGSVLSAANLKLKLAVPWVKKFIARRLAFFLPTLSLGNEIDPTFICHDPKVVEKYRKDKSVSHKMTLRLGAEILRNLDSIFKLAPRIQTPTLMLHGTGDKITSCEGAEEFFHKMKAPHSELKIYPDYYHELFNEIGKERVFADMEKWLEARMA